MPSSLARLPCVCVTPVPSRLQQAIDDGREGRAHELESMSPDELLVTGRRRRSSLSDQVTP